jgi:PAS domain S-box-containing protein
MNAEPSRAQPAGLPSDPPHGEEFFRAAFLASGIPSALVSLDGHVIRANLALEQLLGYEPSGLSGRRVTDFTDKPDLALTEDAIVRGKEPGATVMELRKRYLRRNGHAVDCLASISTVRAGNGDPLYYTTQIIDVSELKRAEVALLDRERILARLVAIQQEIGSTAMNEQDLVPLIVDRACELVDADAATVEMDVDARPVADPGSVLRIPLKHEGRAIGILEVRARPGEVFPERAADLLRLLAGFAAAALSHARDFTRFRSLIENSADPIITVDAAGRVTYVSPSYARMFGRSGAPLIGVSALDIVHPADRSRAAAAIEELVAHAARDVTGEFRVRYDGDNWRTVRLTARNLLREPAVGAIVINLHDVTEEKRLALQLRQAQKLEAVGQLAGGVAHDFNNILTVISGNSEFLANQLKDDSAAFEDIAEIQRAASRATALTRQLLAFSRQQMLQPQVVDLNAIVAGLRPMISRLIGEDIEVDIGLGADPVTVYADPHQVEQVVINLAVNARDAMPSGGRLAISVWIQHLTAPVEYETHVFPEGRFAVLTVSDTGTGMTREVRDQMFQPFFTTKELGRGTGLGLATVYGIVKQSGGYIDVQTAQSEGTRMRIYMPLVDEELPVVAEKDRESAGTASGTILLVEDDPAVRAIARRILLRAGYDVLDAPGPEQAIRIADRMRGKLDLLLTDVVMPKMNGRQLWEQIHEHHPATGVVYMSGYTNDEILRRGGVVGTHIRLVGKPFTPAELLDAVRETLSALKK